MATEKTTIGRFLLRRLKEVGCAHIFGVPGDFVLGFFNEILESEINYIGTCNELNAAYAADGYARVRGSPGCVATTYTVGELSALNGVAGSYAEHVPVIKVTGVPATRFFRERPLLHHSLDDYRASYKAYKNVTCAQVILENPSTAVSDIDAVLTACLVKKAPVYIGLPSDMVLQPIDAPAAAFQIPKPPKSDPCALNEAVLEALRMLSSSRRPLFIPGVEIQRQKLQSAFTKLLTATGVPFATMMLSKALIDETHPQFIGLYCGDRSRPYVQQRVETSDCLFILGERLTDFNTGGFSADLDKRCTIECQQDAVRIMYHTYHGVYIGDFIRELTSRASRLTASKLTFTPATQGCVHRATLEFKVQPESPLTMARFYDRLAHHFKKEAIVIAETGASLFSAAEVLLPTGSTFIGQTFYGSIGYTVGATLGACVAAPDRPVYLFIGDGSFQVTCQDLSTMIRYGCKPQVFLVNNDGYTIERVIVDRHYNDIQPWKYHKLCEVFGGGKAWDCNTEGELDAALGEAEKCVNEQLAFVEIHLDRWDCNDSLRRAGMGMALANGLLTGDELARTEAAYAASAPHTITPRKEADVEDEDISQYTSVVRRPSGAV